MTRIENYTAAVMSTLTTEFPELTSPDTAVIVSEAVRRHATSPTSSLEVILDSTSANWRLRADRATPGRVRLACFRMSPSTADHDRERRINDALALLST